ncbi:MAG: BtpA/SgcQ family protein [Candidatus Bathyarchaeota archaeon]|nr:BtpA/SgcQ family protein [Candidatus Bathyarchaeota archaeon]
MNSKGWFSELFGVSKPIIAMAHIPALPGTPRYDREKGVEHLVKWVARDVENLVEGGVDAIMFCNEDDRPYVFEAGIEQIAAMTRVIAEVKPKIPFGVDFLWDPMAAMAVAHATGARFIREVLTGVYESDMGLWSPNTGKLARFRSQIGADDIRVFYNVVPEFASPLGSRSEAERAHSAVVSSLADVILVSGKMAGAEADLSIIKDIKNHIDAPVFVNTGVKPHNVMDYLSVADGAIVGSSLKKDGYTWNPVDPQRVEEFMDQVKLVRQST